MAEQFLGGQVDMYSRACSAICTYIRTYIPLRVLMIQHDCALRAFLD